MSYNIGEEIAGQYLKICRNCDFVEYNLYTSEVQGEIDVVGIDTKNKKVFICEVAVHLGGLQYTKEGKPDNYARFIKKFEKNIIYTNNRFDDSYEKTYMLWSPVVKDSKEGSKHNQLYDVNRIKHDLKANHNIDLQLIINGSFLKCLDELRLYAGKKTEELKSPILRFMQIEYRLGLHVKGLTKGEHLASTLI
jgi:hypothetical protein